MSDSATKPPTGRREEIEHIEITTAMVDAGAIEFVSFDERFGTIEDAVKDIYLAMRRLEKTS